MTGQPENWEAIFRAKRASSWIGWCLAGGIFAIGAAGVGMVAARVLPVDSMTRQLMTTLPFVFGSLALLSAWRTARAPIAVGIRAEGIRIGYRKEHQDYPWQDVACATTEVGVFRERYMQVYHVDGHRIATITDSIERFADLVARIDARAAARTDDVASKIRLAKARRMSFVFGGMAAIVLLIGATQTRSTYEAIRKARLLQTEGVPGEADIVDYRLAPDGVTPRLVYQITAPDGRTTTRNANVNRTVWEGLANSKTVPVIYVPAEPELSRLEEGEADAPLEGDPFSMYLKPAFWLVLLLVPAGMSVMLWNGWSLDRDSQTGRYSFKPFGTGR